MIVLDASAAVDFLLRREPYETVAQLVRGHDIHSPELLTVEVLHTLRRFEQHGELTAERVAEAVDDLVDLPMEYTLSRRPPWRSGRCGTR